MIPLLPLGLAVLNAQMPAYGAVGDGTTDDTAALQACINAARGDISAWYPNLSDPEDDDIPETAVGTTAFVPRGDYVLTSTLVLENAQFTRIWCSPGTRFIWHGPSDQDVVVMDGTGNWIANVEIVIPEGYSAASGVKLTGRVANNPITSNCGAWRVKVTGECVRAFDVTNIGAEATANNEAHIFSECSAIGYTESCFHFRGSQAHKMHLDHCRGDGQGNGSIFINCEYGAYVRADCCISRNHVAFCYLASTLIVNAFQGNRSIRDSRFVVVGGGSSGTSTGVNMSENYVDFGDALNADKRGLIINTNAPAVVCQNYFRSTVENMAVALNGISNNRVIPFQGNVLEMPDAFSFSGMFPIGAPRGTLVDGGGGNLFNGSRLWLQNSRAFSGFGFDGATPTWNGYGAVEAVEGDTYVDVEFDVEEDDDDYFVASYAIEAVAGTPGALKASPGAKLTTGFRFEFNMAVPAGCTVSVGWMIARAPV